MRRDPLNTFYYKTTSPENKVEVITFLVETLGLPYNANRKLENALRGLLSYCIWIFIDPYGGHGTDKCGFNKESPVLTEFPLRVYEWSNLNAKSSS